MIFYFLLLTNSTDPDKMLLSSAYIFAKSMDPDQAKNNVGPNLNPRCLTLVVPERIF